MFDRGPDKNSVDVSRICVFVLLPRYLVDTWRELREAVQENMAAIDDLVQLRIEKEMGTQGLRTPFDLFSLSKCTLRSDYILEYLFELKSAA